MRRVLTWRAHILIRSVDRMKSAIGSGQERRSGGATATKSGVSSNVETGSTPGTTNKVGSTSCTSAGSIWQKRIENNVSTMTAVVEGEASSSHVSAKLNKQRDMSEIQQLSGLGFDLVQDEEPEVCSCTNGPMGREESADQRDQQETAVYAALRDAPAGVELFDAHCHLQLPPLGTYAHRAVALAAAHGVRWVGVCGTAPGADWEAVRVLHEAHQEAVVPSFGLHPWWIARYLQQARIEGGDEPWAVELEALLRRYPAAHVGECGLDKAVLKDGVSYALQEDVLRRHLQLAGRYGRALTVHCVAGCWDRLLALLKAEQMGVDKNEKKVAKGGAQDAFEGISSMPTAIILHSCNALPKDMVHRFTEVRNVYFSISGGGRAGLSAKTIALALAVPNDRLLLETDSPDQLPAALRGCGVHYNEPALLRYHCAVLAAALGEPPAQLAKRTSDNAARAYQLLAARS